MTQNPRCLDEKSATDLVRPKESQRIWQYQLTYWRLPIAEFVSEDWYEVKDTQRKLSNKITCWLNRGHTYDKEIRNRFKTGYGRDDGGTRYDQYCVVCNKHRRKETLDWWYSY